MVLSIWHESDVCCESNFIKIKVFHGWILKWCLTSLVVMALLYFQPQFFYHLFLKYSFQWDGSEACWGLNKLWILWSLYDQREEHTYRLETDWLFCYILIKEPFDFAILVLYSTTSSCFLSPSKASFLKSKVPFFLCFKEFLMESSNKPFQIALFPPSSLWMYLFFWPTKCTKKKVDCTFLEKRVTF